MDASVAERSAGKSPKNQQILDPLPESASLLLDVIRFSAAVMVVLAHYTHVEFHLGYHDLEFLGDIAVPVFFVLSGFVIRFVTRTREVTLRVYLIDRAARIYSVVLPAMAFTLAVAAACFFIDRPDFLRDWAPTCNHALVRLLANLTFLSQAWGRNTIPFVNSPFWSLGYECIYYLLYGFLFYLRGWKRILPAALVAAIIGPQVLFLLPVWWLGCWLYDFYLTTRRTPFARIVLGVAALWVAAALALALLGHPALLASPVSLVNLLAGIKNPLLALGILPARATMFAVAIGLLSTVALYVLLLAVDRLRLSRQSAWARRVRYVANGTFTIYLMHYPFLLLLTYLGILRFGRNLINPLIATAMCAILIAVAVPIDHLKKAIQRWLRNLQPQTAKPR